MVIEVKHLTKSFNGHPALSDVSFKVDQSDIFGFLGPNGAGKTTTIRSLLQLIYADSGEIRIFDNLIKKNETNHRNRIGYLPGDFKPPSEMKADYFLNYVSGFRDKNPELRDSLINQLKLTSSDLGKKFKYLSHGTRQKVGLVSSMEHNPDLVILDEPTLGLDPLIQEAFYEILLDFRKRDKTVFLSSHILSEIEKVCDQVAIIRNGKIIVVQSLEALKKKQLRRLKIIFDKEYGNNPPELPGTKFHKFQNGKYQYFTELNAQNLIRELGKWPVKNFEFPEPELEDIFMAFYEDKTDD